MTEPDIENTLYGLSQQEQCDMDGVWVKVPRQAVDEAITLLRKLERYQWQPIETAPHGKNVLLAYKNCLGKSRVVKAAFLEKYSVEENSYDDFVECCDYHEEHDTYYWPEGWYEQIDNWDDLSAVAIDKGNIERAVGWMPLPATPEDDQ